MKRFNSLVASVKEKLFQVGLKKPFSELCGWAQKTEDGRIPVELGHNKVLIRIIV